MKHRQSYQAHRPVDVASTIKDFATASRKHATSSRRLNRLFIVGSLVCIVIVLEVKRLQGSLAFYGLFTAIVIVILLGLALQLLTRAADSAQSERQKAATKLKHARELSCLGPLIEHITLSDVKSGSRTLASVMDLLPRLHGTAAEGMEPHHWKLLADTLDAAVLTAYSRNGLTVEYYVRALEALASFGHSDAVTTMTRLSEIRAANAGLARVRECATASLAILQERLTRQAVGDDLLRPSEDAERTLLRPVRPNDVEDNRNLLRPLH